mmetsp:Transcript_41601/g.66054  ORF Transcript_41601/g.66054 Transcript_41601/m.66054 type:complete len:1038 (-) Transcript_41601:17-3130(-)
MSPILQLCLWLSFHIQASIATRDERRDGDQLWLDETIGDVFDPDNGRANTRYLTKPSQLAEEARSKALPRAVNDGLVVAKESHVPVIGEIPNVDVPPQAIKSVGVGSHSSALRWPFQPLPFQSDGGEPVLVTASTASAKSSASVLPASTEAQKIRSLDLPLPFQPEAESSSIAMEGSIIADPWPLPFQNMRKNAVVIASPLSSRAVSTSSPMLIQSATPVVSPKVGTSATWISSLLAKIRRLTTRIASLFGRSTVESSAASMANLTKPPFETITNRGANKASGGATNAVGDGRYFVTNVFLSLGVIVICMLLFSVARMSNKLVYSSRSEIADDTYRMPNRPSQGFCSWILDSVNMKHAMVNEVSGIDQAMLVYYTELCMKVLIYLFIPLCLIEIPLNIWCGGNAAGQDHLSWQGMANVLDDRPYIYWFYAFLVWYVVLVSMWLIFRGMREFIRVRYKWLELLPAMRAQTILVEGIPDELLTDAQVKHYFERATGGPYVAQAALVKATHKDLKTMMTDYHYYKASLDKAQQHLAQTGERPQLTGADALASFSISDPVGSISNIASVAGVGANAGSGQVAGSTQQAAGIAGRSGSQQNDAITYHEGKVNVLSQNLTVAQQNLLAHADTEDSGVCYNRGFVTFNKMSATAAALTMTYNEDQDLFVCAAAPDPADIDYEAFMVSSHEMRVREVIGYCHVWTLATVLVVPVYLIASNTLSTEIVETMPFLKPVLEPKIMRDLYDAWFGSAAIAFIMVIIPTMLMYIFRQFFVLRSSVDAQLLCQKIYFYMLFVYVLLAISIGSSLAADMKELAKHPTAIFRLLATSLPESSHYYLNFVVFQCMAPIISLTRFPTLIKFGLHKLKGDKSEDAHKHSEPEDQHFSGIGSRSARLTLIMVVTLSFCTLSPLIVILGIFNFGFCRIAYGYLVSYAETPKPEIGGAFFATQMKHTQAGLVFYVILMSGVLFQRAENSYPAVISACSFAPLIWGMARFDRAFKWQALPVGVVKEDDSKPFVFEQGQYIQPELVSVATPQKWQLFSGSS